MKFNTRNELVSDIIDSLKEVGFVVDDPQFADPANPSGVVLLVANRGSERMEASIDLSDEIHSTWNNLSEEHCKTAFFDYVDAMSSKGVKVKPHREDLQNRPIKRQQALKISHVQKVKIRKASVNYVRANLATKHPRRDFA